MIDVGVTGGAASGKSAVTAALRRRGAAVCDADDIVESLYEPGRAGTEAVTAAFGTGVLDDRGAVDRAALAAVVLGDGDARRRLEAAVHPLVRDELARWRAAVDRDPARPAIAVVEAALLVETGSWRAYDRLVVVTAPLDLRRSRALAAGWDAARFERTVAAQADDAARLAVADYEVVNDTGPDALERSADTLAELLRADAAAASDGAGLAPRRLSIRAGETAPLG